jgi:hypothetical protein
MWFLGGLEVDFPVETRGERVRRTLAASGAMIFLLLVTTTLIFTWKAELANDPDTNFYLLLVPSALNAIQITVYAVVYKEVADKLTDFENHKTVVDHNAALFRKLTLFYFLSNFSAPLYIAFFKSQVMDKKVWPFFYSHCWPGVGSGFFFFTFYFLPPSLTLLPCLPLVVLFSSSPSRRSRSWAATTPSRAKSPCASTRTGPTPPPRTGRAASSSAPTSPSSSWGWTSPGAWQTA